MTRQDFAALTGVTGPAVRQWITDGMPAQRTSKAGNASYQIDPPIALQWLFAKRIAKAVKAERVRMERRYNLIPEMDDDDWERIEASLAAGIATL